MGEEQPKQAGEQKVERLFEAAEHDVARVVGMQPGTVDRFATPRTGFIRPKTYWEAWERWPEDLGAALVRLEAKRKSLGCDRALAVVTERRHRPAQDADLQSGLSRVLSYRSFALELSGIADRVRMAVQQYGGEKGEWFYLSRRGQSASGVVSDVVEYIKNWACADRGTYLALIGPRFSGRAETVYRAMYEIGRAFMQDPDSVIPIVGYAPGNAAKLAFDDGLAIAVSPDPWFYRSGYRTLVIGHEADVSNFEAHGADIVRLLAAQPIDIERWFRGRLDDTILERFLSARKLSPAFEELSNALPNIGFLLGAMKDADVATPATPGDWIAEVSVSYMESVLSARKGILAPVMSKVDILEDAAFEEFALGRIIGVGALAEIHGRHAVDAQLSTWLVVDVKPRSEGAGSPTVEAASFSNMLIRDYFIARRIIRDTKRGDLEIFARYQFPRNDVLLFLAVLSPGTAAQISESKMDSFRRVIEDEVERRLELTLGHLLNRSAGAINSHIKAIKQTLRQEDLSSQKYRFGRIDEELAFLKALSEETRLLHEVPDGPLEGLSIHEYVLLVIKPLEDLYPAVRREVVVSPLLRVRANREVLREILHCLVENAFQAAFVAARDREPLVRVEARAEGETIRIDIIDSGHGVRPADHARIFEPYVTTKKGGDQPLGTGLGLTIARRYAERMGGQVDIDPASTETCFFLRIVAWKDPS